MTAVIESRATTMPIIVYQGHRVVTLAMVDTEHQRPEGTAGRNYRANKERMTEGRHFFRVCADEFRRHNPGVISDKAHEDVILLTERGYLMLVKSFTDDLAWDVQERLIDGYFRRGDTPARLPSPLELMVQQAQALVEIDRQQKAIASKQEQQAAVQVEQQAVLDRVESRIEEVADRAKVLSIRPTNTESITHMRPRLFKEYGLLARVVDEVIRQSPYALSPLVVVNTKAEVDGATYEVFHIKQVNAVFRRFVDECTRVTAAFVTHPYIQERFRLKPGFGRAAS